MSEMISQRLNEELKRGVIDEEFMERVYQLDPSLRDRYLPWGSNKILMTLEESHRLRTIDNGRV